MKKIFLLNIFILISTFLFPQKVKTDANIVGHVVSEGKHIPFVHIIVKGTTIGTSTGESGHYQLINLPPGKNTIKTQVLGFQSEEITVNVRKGETKEVKFDLEPDIMGLETVVVTGDRNEQNRKEASVIVNAMTPRLFTNIQASTVSESMNFCPGLRIENNCQNCGFNQVRMNGLEGPYSQILINSQPIYSGLMGVYGIELIPSNIIDRIEVVRGGGSALYGSNATAGTINLILKDPINNSYEFGTSGNVIGTGVKGSGDVAQDYTVNANASVVSPDHKTGMAVYGFFRKRQPWDANNDDFSELAMIKNTTFGTRLFHRLGYKSRISADFFNINENRRGGNKFDEPEHEADIAEAVDHRIISGALSFETFLRSTDRLSVYVAAQNVGRDSYYGAEQSLKDYGKTNSFSYNAGAQYHWVQGISKITGGIESRGESLNDKKSGYPDLENAYIGPDSSFVIPHAGNTTIADQATNTTGAFAQYELTLEKFKLSVGARYDHYTVSDKKNYDEDKSGNVLSPRVTVLYDVRDYLQARVSFSQGFRAPQIFDEDLHIETSGSRQVIHENDPDLKQETSNSFMASLDFNKSFGLTQLSILAEGFYTMLNDAFVNEYGEPDSNGVVIYTRKNAGKGANVYGLNLELNLYLNQHFNLGSGFTIQKSHYEEVQDFDTKDFLRTPDQYGYLTMEVKPIKKLVVSVSGTYTGTMLVPYFGTEIPNPEEGELRTSKAFLDMGLKLRYNIKLNGATLQLFTGIKNIFNSYQDDFDRSINRDPGYIYGPLLPRTVYFGFKIGNMLGD